MSDLPFFGGSFLNSSASPRTRFMWRSKAMNLAAGAETQSQQLIQLFVGQCTAAAGQPANHLPPVQHSDPHPVIDIVQQL